MAMVNITFDTSSKECSVSINNTKLDNVERINIFKDYDYSTSEPNPAKIGYLEIYVKEPETDGMRRYTHICAKEDMPKNKAFNAIHIGDVELLETSDEAVSRGAFELFNREKY